jgi:hypothetical protein
MSTDDRELEPITETTRETTTERHVEGDTIVVEPDGTITATDDPKPDDDPKPEPDPEP